MAYWIHENGETIGPLRAIEILERAQPDTLVSQGQEWVKFADHPDFLPIDEPDLREGLRDSDGGKSLPGERHRDTSGMHPQPVPRFHEPANPRGSNAVATLPASSRRRTPWGVVLAVTLVGVVLLSLTPSAKTHGKRHQGAATQGNVHGYDRTQPTGNFVQHDKRPAIWAYSELLSPILWETMCRTFISEDKAVEGAYEDLNNPTCYVGMVSLNGHVARVDRLGWQSANRETQKGTLSAIARISCRCIDPQRWRAEVRDAESGVLLAAISPNGLRALWTPEGMLPERVSASARIDPLAPMSNEEEIRELQRAVWLMEGFFGGHHLVRGSVIEPVVRWKWFNEDHYGMIVVATTEPLGEFGDKPFGATPTTYIEGTYAVPQRILILDPDKAEIPRSEGAYFESFLSYQSEYELGTGTKIQSFGTIRSARECSIYLAERQRLVDRIVSLGGRPVPPPR